MEIPEKRRKNKKAARTQHPQRYCPPSFLVKRMSLSDDKIELGVPARLNLRVLTVLTEICKNVVVFYTEQMTTAQPRQPNPTNASLSIPVSLVPRQLAVRKYPRGQGGLLENKVNRSGDENQMNQAPDA
ncbi:hypothetical protein ALC57_08998 [Trachymyrmex cornetzi]|uniref:Uncharacterized protein n=1 Tax=Trachymyrmex cornetzi TaxID=471704 RepID=A0A151J652_9HYME|nr:hypothetical protein ALC57_08998 [Trachymyrmex cornetzi]